MNEDDSEFEVENLCTLVEDCCFALYGIMRFLDTCNNLNKMYTNFLFKKHHIGQRKSLGTFRSQHGLFLSINYWKVLLNSISLLHSWFQCKLIKNDDVERYDKL